MDAMEKIVEDAVVGLIRRAVTRLSPDVIAALETARASETDAAAGRELDIMLENVREAGRCMLPMCQDTGIPVFFVKSGRFQVPGLEDTLTRAVRRATEEVPLRRNVVDPLTRANTGDNTGVRMPYISWSSGNEDYLEITYLPKGAGSENMSALAMLNPSAGVPGIKQFVVDTIVRAEGKPCPPVIVGVGVGGSADACMALAKKALLRPVGSRNEAQDYARLERELLELINATGIGPMGLGGRTTALAVHVEQAGCHTATLPVGVNLQCYAARRASLKIFRDGRISYEGD
ncbi:MAG TPA: fumarate hydratase [Methanocella sp.]|jgi:fumarate hydratase subunit alpha